MTWANVVPRGHYKQKVGRVMKAKMKLMFNSVYVSIKLEQPILIVLLSEIKVDTVRNVLLSFQCFSGFLDESPKYIISTGIFQIIPWDENLLNLNIHLGKNKQTDKVLLSIRCFRPLKVNESTSFLRGEGAMKRGLHIWNLLNIYYMKRIFR